MFMSAGSWHLLKPRASGAARTSAIRRRQMTRHLVYFAIGLEPIRVPMEVTKLRKCRHSCAKWIRVDVEVRTDLGLCIPNERSPRTLVVHLSGPFSRGCFE